MQVMAERVLTFIETGTNRELVVRVLLGLPRLDDRGQDWPVEYEIHGPGLERVIRRRTSGIDAIQALVMTLNVIIPAQFENLADLAGGAFSPSKVKISDSLRLHRTNQNNNNNENPCGTHAASSVVVIDDAVL